MTLSERFRAARRDPALAVLEGFHTVKHALRFGAELLELVVLDRGALSTLCQRLAPDLEPGLAARARTIAAHDYAQLAPQSHPTGVMGLARRPPADPTAILAATGDAPVVLLQEPAHLGNLGASVRVAAAAGALGLLSTGTHDPWSPEAVRAAAGLQYALPTARLDTLERVGSCSRPLVAVTPEGDRIDRHPLPTGCLLAFGTERLGLSRELRERADARISLPMRTGISSLNVATAVAATLYAWRLGIAADG